MTFEDLVERIEELKRAGLNPYARVRMEVISGPRVPFTTAIAEVDSITGDGAAVVLHGETADDDLE